MKKLHLLFFILFYAKILFSQVIISPYVVYMDEYNKYGSMIVQNESMESYEVSISFVFGYPISDSLGNRTMKYEPNPDDSLPSINGWIKAFPKKIILNPKERQTIRMMVKPPAGLKDGTYWTRIVTSSLPIENDVDSTKGGVSAKVKFVLNQVTTAIYRKGKNEVNLSLTNPKIFKDSSDNYQFLYGIKKGGNSPFYGNLYFNIYDEMDSLITSQKDYLSIFFDIYRNYNVKNNILKSGKYRAELVVEYNEKMDIPESKLKPIPNTIKEYEFTIE